MKPRLQGNVQRDFCLLLEDEITVILDTEEVNG
jgi:hypothetical protein